MVKKKGGERELPALGFGDNKCCSWMLGAIGPDLDRPATEGHRRRMRLGESDQIVTAGRIVSERLV
jgi:hypothetical protein